MVAKNILSICVLCLFFGCNVGDSQWDLDTIDQLPIVVTSDAVNVSNVSASVSYDVISDGGSSVTQRGVCWSTDQNPTISDDLTNQGAGTGSFTSVLSNLTLNTTYYVRAYAINEVGVAYGNEISFLTTNNSNSLPSVNTLSISNITNNGATCGGDVTADGGAFVTERGVCWSTNQSPTLSNSVNAEGSGTGTFSSNLSNLSTNTTYYVRAYAINEVGISYGNEVSFTTSSPSNSIPTVSTLDVTGISYNSASSGGNITSDGGASITQRGICWGTNQNPTLSDNNTNQGIGIGSFTSTIPDLSPNTTYYVRAYAINDVGVAYGSVLSFTTTSAPANLVDVEDCADLFGVSSIYYGINGTSDTWGLSNNGYNGVCWMAPPPSASGALGTLIGSNHYVEFNRLFNSDGYIEFWVNTPKPGHNNLIPVITVNGNDIGDVEVIEGQLSSFYWMKVRSSVIVAGSSNIRISFNGSYYDLKIDEIEFYEY